MARVADHVYDHVLAVCRSAPVARSAAADVLGRAPRSLAGALAAARVRALEVGSDATPAEPVGSTPVPDGLRELAWLLAATRPVTERSTVDLALRHGLDRVGLGRALGTPPARAAADADAVVDHWERDLRPALLAFLGPGDCDGLRAVLAEAGLAAPAAIRADEPSADAHDAPVAAAEADAAGDADASGDPPHDVPAPPTVDELLAVAPAVAEHVERCDVCPDRVRAMATVRSLLAHVPIVAAPPGLHPASWRRWPAGASANAHRGAPVGDGHPAAPARRRAPWRPWAVAGAGVAAVAAAITAVIALADGGGDDDVAVLTRVPARNALAAVPDEIGPGDTFVLESTVERPLRWRVRPTEPWVVIEPRSGTLRPRAATEVEVRLDDAAPEGPLRLDLTITGADGSTVLVRLRGSVEHPPTVAATADACAVTAQVEDESEVGAVDLHWRGESGDTASRPMAATDDGYRAAIPAMAVPVRWWVTAVDGRGNRVRSPEYPLASC